MSCIAGGRNTTYMMFGSLINGLDIALHLKDL